MLHSKKGFTLIEILVVISIIALLAGITIAAVGPARVKGRDAQRVADLANIRIALALYKSANGKYPIPVDSDKENPGWGADKTVCSLSSACQERWDALKIDLTPYGTVSIDPLNKGISLPSLANSYHYAYRSMDGITYDLIAQFEDTNNPNRCELKDWKYHTSGETSWCPPFDPSSIYSPYLYADH